MIDKKSWNIRYICNSIALLLEMHNGTDIPTSKINSEKMDK